MTLITAEQIDHAMDWSTFGWNAGVGAAYGTPFGPAVLHEFEGACDHETCYETHDTRLVIAIGNRYFLKTGTYDSHDSYQWTGRLKEVKPVEKTIQDWDDVPVYAWDLAGINSFLAKWMGVQPARGCDDWVGLFYKAEDGLDIEGFPWTITGVETYAPGEPESNGPVWLIFEINGVKYAAKGRNVSHVGWDFDSVYGLEIVEKKTVTMEVWA